MEHENLRIGIIGPTNIHLTSQTAGLDPAACERTAEAAGESLAQRGYDVVLVSSGAIGAGVGRLNLTERPVTIPEKQAVAAVGQVALIHLYQKLFFEYNKNIAQLLLTRGDFAHRRRFLNGRNACFELIKKGVIPIINENDAVATEEIKVGDNDTLSAAVATLVHADLLLILTDTDGVFTADPHIHTSAQKVPKVMKASDDLKDVDLNGSSKMGSGGMVSKIAAAELCREHNVDVVIADGNDPTTILEVLAGKDLGTFFVSDATNQLTT